MKEEKEEKESKPKRRDSTRKATKATSRNGSSDFSVRFGKNSDKGKVAIVSSKSGKIVYEQG